MREKVVEVMSNVLGVPVESLNDESSPDTIESWDSLKHIDLTMSLEEEFGITIDDSQMLEMMSTKLILLTLAQLKAVEAT